MVMAISKSFLLRTRWSITLDLAMQHWDIGDTNFVRMMLLVDIDLLNGKDNFDSKCILNENLKKQIFSNCLSQRFYTH